MFQSQRKPPGSAPNRSPAQMLGFVKAARTPAVIGMPKDPSIPGLPANAAPPPLVNLAPPVGRIRNPIRTKGISAPRSAVPPRL